MYKMIEIDEVVDYLHINFLIINLNPELVYIDKVLAKYQRPNPELALILNLMLGYDEFPFDRFGLGLHGIYFRDVVHIIGREIVGQVGFEQERRHRSALFTGHDASHYIIESLTFGVVVIVLHQLDIVVGN